MFRLFQLQPTGFDVTDERSLLWNVQPPPSSFQFGLNVEEENFDVSSFSISKNTQPANDQLVTIFHTILCINSQFMIYSEARKGHSAVSNQKYMTYIEGKPNKLLTSKAVTKMSDIHKRHGTHNLINIHTKEFLQ